MPINVQEDLCLELTSTRQRMDFEEDPAAAFLAREQDELAGIADDTLGVTTADTEVSCCQK